MKKNMIVTAMTLPLFSFAGYVSIVQKVNNNYINGYIVNVEYSEWTNINTNCSNDIEESDIYFNLTATQTTSCIENQERTKTTKHVYENGNETVVSVTTETQAVNLPDQIQTITGTHLEDSCNKIITNNYANTDSNYYIGTSSDYFSVYCDMRGTEGWTLVSKVPVGDTHAGAIPINWFLTGYNNTALNVSTFSYNETMSSIGIDKIKKIGHTGLSELQIISEDQTQGVPFYKTINNSNLEHWFQTTEPTQTTVCTNSSMTQNCESSSFELWSNRYWLRGVDLRKYGFNIIDEVVQDVHFNLHGNVANPTLCSVTGNIDGNAWHDSAADGHWGNGMVVYIK